MGTYRLSAEAEADLRRIWLYGFHEYGETHADKYYNGLIEHFEKIADQPYLYQAVDYIREGYRRSVYGADSIYYRINSDVVEIMAIIGRQDIEERF
ncbi:type II toxin-antitoxin system RelE/ParE family toxin [methane-oxidizing endosymbiont of Gigantopelta aegis]|uniref:type II toxin-antitoxin system RelE/ParE family toxin n=1 Tax=methane-oxidizing endosymbiont of Gigantopelta aegis TaxID=2794938 RepID=UPI0018DE2F50|nr:type II toxin-antitoxin system RelE/ParE family toxin [methane-oxidizing endosymbiont of Gigantopelta aegis]